MAEFINFSDISFKHPCTAILSGPSGSGKSTHLFNVLSDYKYLFNGLPEDVKVLYVYGVWSEDYDRVIDDLQIDFQENFPTEDQIKHYDIIVFDDCMSEFGKDERLAKIFTKWSHHFKTTVFFITQNLFFRSSQFRDASINVHHLILFKSRRDIGQVQAIARQIYPSDASMFLECYTDATNPLHGYIRVCLVGDCKEQFRLTTRYTRADVKHLKRKFSPIIYVPNDLVREIEGLLKRP